MPQPPQPPQQPPTPPPPPQRQTQTETSQNIHGVRVQPGLPDPNSGKIYRLQIGRWYTEEVADYITALLQSAGFNAAQENNQGLYWVYATDVPASIVSHAIQRLAALGIREVHLWE